MKEAETMKGLHLTLDDRLTIQEGLKQGLTLNEIAQLIHKSPRTVAYEIKQHMRVRKNGRADFMMIEKTLCFNYLKYPFVCDNCPMKKGCLSDYHEYSGRSADLAYRYTLKHARTGINLTSNELAIVDEVIAKGVKLGQSIEHIVATHKELPVGVRSIYRYIESGSLKTKQYQMRYMSLKKRKVQTTPKKEAQYYANRSFMDYLAYISKNPGKYTTQLDTVHGKRGDTKVMMTLVIIELHFFYAVIIDRATAESITDAFEYIYGLLGHEDFKRLFGLILTDRGLEFSRPDLIEYSTLGEVRSKVFFCDPLASYQKGAIESIHRLLRYVFPKGKSLDFVTQDKVEHFISAINSYKIRSNQYQTAYELMTTIFGKTILDKLNVRAIDPDAIHLTPLLVK